MFYYLYYIKVLFLHIEYAMPREKNKTRLNLRELVLVTKILKSQKRFETYLFQSQETNVIEKGKTIKIHFDGRLLSAGSSTKKDKALKKKKLIRGVKHKKNCLFINILGSNLCGPLLVSTMVNIKSNYPEKPHCKYFVTAWVINYFNAARMQCSVLSRLPPTFVRIIAS